METSSSAWSILSSKRLAPSQSSRSPALVTPVLIQFWWTMFQPQIHLLCLHWHIHFYISLSRNAHSFLWVEKSANYKNTFYFITNCCFNCAVRQLPGGKGRMASMGIRRNWIRNSDCVLLYKTNRRTVNYVVLHNSIGILTTT